jgi:hypothetical protein
LMERGQVAATDFSRMDPILLMTVVHNTPKSNRRERKAE